MQRILGGAQHLQCFIYILVTSESKEQHIDLGNVKIDHILNPLFDQITLFKGKPPQSYSSYSS